MPSNARQSGNLVPGLARTGMLNYLNNNEMVVGAFKVVSSTSVATHQWSYVVQPCILGVYDTDVPKASVMTDATYVKAWNVYEIGNTATVAMGITVADLPGTFALAPIPDDAIVPGCYAQGEERMMVYLWWPNQFDGACS